MANESYGGIRKRLTMVIFVSFGVVFLMLSIIGFIIISKLDEIKVELSRTYQTTDESLKTATETSRKMFEISALQKVESLAASIAAVAEAKEIPAHEIGENAIIQRIVLQEKIGEHSDISIIDPVNDRIILDKYYEAGTSYVANIPVINRLIREKNYLERVASSKEAGGLAQAANIATAFDNYELNQGTLDDPQGIKGTQNYLAVITPIVNTDYSLSAVISLGGLRKTILAEIEKTRMRNTEMLGQIERETKAVKTITYSASIFGVIFVLVLLVFLYKMTTVRILDPVRELMVTADKIRAGEYDRRVDLIIMTEDFRHLGVTINRMLDTITELIESEEDKKRLQENIILLLDIVSKASGGDLSVRGKVTKDVLGSVTDAFNMMMDSISQLIVQVKVAGKSISAAAVKILDTSRKISIDAKRQGREIHNVTGRVQQASRMMQKVSFSASMANEESQRAVLVAKEGGRRVTDTITSMQKMRSNVMSTSKTIKTLGERTLEINQIVELINDISQRTNMLSMNAAIEASKAGEHGMGFAVVAEEIGKLGKKTATATKDISSFIEDIKIETNDAVIAMEEVTHEVEQGWKQSDEAGAALRDIQAVVTAAAEKIMEISSVSSDMVAQMDEVVEEIKSIYQVAQETTEGITKASNETRNLFTPLDELNALLSRFKLHPRSFEDVDTTDFLIDTVKKAYSQTKAKESLEQIVKDPSKALASHDLTEEADQERETSDEEGENNR